MGKAAERLNIDFVVSTGDNFYDNGLEGVDDPAFEDSFTKIYTAEGLQKQWYSSKYLTNIMLSSYLLALAFKTDCDLIYTFCLKTQIKHFPFFSFGKS